MSSHTLNLTARSVAALTRQLGLGGRLAQRYGLQVFQKVDLYSHSEQRE